MPTSRAFACCLLLNRTVLTLILTLAHCLAWALRPALIDIFCGNASWRQLGQLAFPTIPTSTGPCRNSDHRLRTNAFRPFPPPASIHHARSITGPSHAGWNSDRTRVSRLIMSYSFNGLKAEHQTRAVMRSRIRRPGETASGHPSPEPVFSLTGITLEKNEKIRPQPDR
jgi:hypothetical protein